MKTNNEGIEKEEIDYSKINYTREWFDENQAHTIWDIITFKNNNCDNIIHEREHFLLDLYPIYENGENRGSTDVEIWEVELTKQTFYDKIRKQWFPFKPIRKITTGKQFGYPNGYWKLRGSQSKEKEMQELKHKLSQANLMLNDKRYMLDRIKYLDSEPK